jgi:hypothetical protein
LLHRQRGRRADGCLPRTLPHAHHNSASSLCDFDTAVAFGNVVGDHATHTHTAPVPLLGGVWWANPALHIRRGRPLLAALAKAADRARCRPVAP